MRVGKAPVPNHNSVTTLTPSKSLKASTVAGRSLTNSCKPTVTSIARLLQPGVLGPLAHSINLPAGLCKGQGAYLWRMPHGHDASRSPPVPRQRYRCTSPEPHQTRAARHLRDAHDHLARDGQRPAQGQGTQPAHQQTAHQADDRRSQGGPLGAQWRKHYCQRRHGVVGWPAPTPGLRGSGIPLTAVVVCGVDPAAMPSIDQGARRNGPDHLRMHDFTNSGTLAATARWVWRFERGQMRQKAVGLRDHALPPYVQAWPSLPVSLPWGRKLRDMLPESLAAALFHLFQHKDAALAKPYFVALESGIDLSQSHPARIVRDRLLKDKSPRNHTGVVARGALVTLGWNSLRAGEPYGTGFTWKGERDESVRFPTIM